MNRARGERAKHETAAGAPDTADLEACPPGQVIDVSEYHPPSTPPPDGGRRIVELCFDDPFPACHGVAKRRRDYDTEPVMASANDPDFAA